MKTDLSARQSETLRILAASRTPLRGDQVARLLSGFGNSPQGATQTLSSLIRHGLAEKTTRREPLTGNRRVYFTPTAAGRRLVR